MRSLTLILVRSIALPLTARSTSRGVQLFESSEWAAAKTELTHVLRRNEADARPGDPYGRYHVGRLAAASGLELAQGEEGIRAFIANAPRDAGIANLSLAYLRLGQVLRQDTKSPDAMAVFKPAMMIDPGNDEAKKAVSGS